MATMPRRGFSKIERQILSRILKCYPNRKLPTQHSRRLLNCMLRVYTHPTVSAHSRVFDKAEEKLSTQHRELCGIRLALQTYEFYIIGLPFPLYLFCDHKPILLFWIFEIFIIDFSNIKSY